MKRFKYISLCLSLFLGSATWAQEIELPEKIDLAKAIETAMTNNYDIKIARAEADKAQNSHHIGNAGLLPSVSASGGGDFSVNDTEIQFMNMGGGTGSGGSTGGGAGGGAAPDDTPTPGDIMVIDGAESISYNASIRMDYTIFDGFGNVYTYKKLEGASELQETLYRQQMEMTIVQVAEQYYEVCRAQQNYNLAQQSLDISKERYQKAVDQKTYGQANQLDLLNAEVDMNSDSTLLLQTEQQLLMSLKNLNVVMGIGVNNSYEVNDSVTYRDDLTADYVTTAAMTYNASIVAQLQQTEISELDMKITRARKMPSISAYGSYGYNRTDNEASQVIYNQNRGFSTGLSASFNIFNGRQQRIAEQNAKIDLATEKERQRQTEAQIERDIANAYTDYTYKKRIVELQRTSLKQARLNFESTKEMFALGRSTSIEFRTAQENLLNVANQFSDAQFQAKVSEFYLLQLSGLILNDPAN
ncbi:TolC family protein [Persicobacter psychrovividus]